MAWQSETGWCRRNLPEPSHDQVRQERVQLQRPLHQPDKFARGKDSGKIKNDVTQIQSM
jgi:hypothetical protein